MEEFGIGEVKHRAVKGVVMLTGRTFLLNILSFVAQGFLWAFLGQYEFGVFWIVSAIINFLSYFSDIGLAAALIQKKEEPTKEDLKTTFTIQQILVATLLLALFLLSPLLAKVQSLTHDGRILLLALGFSFFLSSLKTIPSILLERKLKFEKLVLAQVVETVVYNIVLVYLAFLGWGLKSFTLAVLIRGFLGLGLIYALNPWKPGFIISRKSLGGLLKFGVPYQVNTFLATLKDDGITIALGSILGPAGVGILGTAQRLAQYPLRFFMDNVTKVTFPAFARMQEEKEQLKGAVTRSIFFICFLVFPSLFGLIIISPILITVIPRYEKWAPALIPLALIGINTVFAAVTTQLTNMLNAIGKIKTTFYLMIMWTALAWILIPALAIKYGVIGAAAGYALVGVSSVVAIYVARRVIAFSLYEAAVRPLLAAFVMSVVLIFLKRGLPFNLGSVAILVAVGIITYMTSIYLIIGPSIVSDVKKTVSMFFNK